MNDVKTKRVSPSTGSEDRCPECGGNNIFTDFSRGERVCMDCGLVQDDRVMDRAAEWRSFTPQEEQKRSRVGAPLSLLRPDKGLTTEIGGQPGDLSSGKMTASKRAKIRRLRWVNKRARSGQERNLRKALRELSRLSSALGLPSHVQQEAATIYRKALKKNLIRGRSISSMIAASLYAACRLQKIPRTLRDIVQVSQVSEKDLSKAFRVLIEELKIRRAPLDVNKLVFRLGSSLNLTMPTQKKAIELLERAKEKNIMAGKNPTSMAAACLYLSGIITGERRTQQQIADIANTTPVTLRNRVKELIKELGLENIEVKRGAAAAPVYFTDEEEIPEIAAEF
jgi:transcription initiation factor TFIIB